MLDAMLAINPGTGDKAGNWYFDNLGEPVVYAVIGFVVVFVGIVILIAIIWLLGLLMRKTDNFSAITDLRKSRKHEDTIEIKKTAAAESDEVPDEVKAAIIAAIMAYYESRQKKCEFTVKRIKKL